MKKNLVLSLVLLCLQLYGGTGTLTDRSTGQTITSAFFNDIHSAIKSDFVGRNSSGVATAGQNLGTSTYPWGSIYTQLTSGHACYITTNGVITSEAALSKSRGGTGADNSSVTFPSTGTITTRDATESLSNKTLSGVKNAVVATKTTTYTATVTDYFIPVSASGGSWTLSLPAATNTGQTYVISRRDQTFANAVTVDPNGSDTVGGSATTTLNTLDETLILVADGGTNWYIQARNINSKETTWTPDLIGFGTETVVEAYWLRIGNRLRARVTYTLGTPTSVEAQCPLPVGLTTASNIATLEIAGGFARNAAYGSDAVAPIIIAEPSKAYVTYGYSRTSTAQLAKQNGDQFGTSGNTHSIWFEVPITGWN